MEQQPLKVKKNDLVIICAYAQIKESLVSKHKPKLIYFKKNSNVIDTIKIKNSNTKKT